jgi:hypothetical protein
VTTDDELEDLEVAYFKDLSEHFAKRIEGKYSNQSAANFSFEAY